MQQVGLEVVSEFEIKMELNKSFTVDFNAQDQLESPCNKTPTKVSYNITEPSLIINLWQYLVRLKSFNSKFISL